ncbi:MAG TPA: hypothetical protein VFE24_05155 [Pirellulales bacterium]|jgi:hypothetical protein|nr:hypothetical protein [Pirellulales bacterium]
MTNSTPQPLSADRTPDPLPTDAKKPRRRRRWLRFGLKTLFVLTTICAAATWRGVSWYRALAEEDAAIQGFESEGVNDITRYRPGEDPWLNGLPPRWFAQLVGLGDVYPARYLTLPTSVSAPEPTKSQAPPKGPFDDDTLSGPQVRYVMSDSDLAWLSHLHGLENLRIESSPPPAKLLQVVSRLPNLQELSLAPEVVGDGKELGWFANTPTLRNLFLRHASLSSDGYVAIGTLVQLRRLGLADSNCDNEDLSHLLDMRNLQILFLDGSTITGEGPATLSRLPRLSTLGLSNTSIDSGCIAAFAETHLESIVLSFSENNLSQVLHLRHIVALSIHFRPSPHPVSIDNLKPLRTLQQLRYLYYYSLPLKESDRHEISSWFPKAHVMFID